MKNDDVWEEYGYTCAHEYGHAVMHDKYGWFDYSRKFWNYISDHTYRRVTNVPTAFCEGWAEFFGYAVISWMRNKVDYPYRVESYYAYNGYPYWQGEPPYGNINGTKVEGAVMQNLWDIWGYKDINDGDPGWDDEGINGLIYKIWKVISKYEPNDITYFWYGWEEEGYPNIEGNESL